MKEDTKVAKKGHSAEQILGALPRCRTSRRLTVLAADVGPRHALPPVGKRSHHEARTRAVVAFASLDQPHALQCFWKEQNVEHEGRNGSINQEVIYSTIVEIDAAKGLWRTGRPIRWRP